MFMRLFAVVIALLFTNLISARDNLIQAQLQAVIGDKIAGVKKMDGRF